MAYDSQQPAKRNPEFKEAERPYVLEFVRYAASFAAVIAIALLMLSLASKAAAQ